MDNKKYELTSESREFLGHELFRIRALLSFGIVLKGEMGGFIESEENVSQSGNAWVSGNAQVYGNARVYGNAWVYGNAQVYGDAWVFGNAQVAGNARVSGDAKVYGDARVYGNAQVRKTTDYFTAHPIGSRHDAITLTKSNKCVATGCFYGTFTAFIKAIKQTHGTNQHATNYLALLKFVGQMWKESDNDR